MVMMLLLSRAGHVVGMLTGDDAELFPECSTGLSRELLVVDARFPHPQLAQRSGHGFHHRVRSADEDLAIRTSGTSLASIRLSIRPRSCPTSILPSSALSECRDTMK